MKRFVTYLYECERGNKSKNVGFIRVNVRGDETSMEVYIRNVSRGRGKGTIYAFIYMEELHAIEIGEVVLENGQSDTRLIIQTENIVDSGFSINDIEGIGICIDSGVYIVSCWKDAYADTITRGEYIVMGQEEPVIASSQYQSESSEQEVEPPVDVSWETMVEKPVTYEKIDLSQIRELPSPNWHLATNSFLVHGFWNYGYLVLKKEMAEGEETISLGVPGIYEKPEAVMAVLFGFPDFEAISPEIEALAKEKNQEAVAGTFGCWFTNLKM